ncbi:MAG TPA: ATP-binding protein [Candidatus Acidoferrum sp.]|nr:ATP-binding protein [Candidatus Acidoferrum sp.]
MKRAGQECGRFSPVPVPRRGATQRSLSLLISAVAFLLAATASGQGLEGMNLRVFKLADGLAESACMSVTVAPQGKVLTRHTGVAGVSELNGYTIRVYPAPGEGASRIYGGPAGQLWTVSPLGLEEFSGESWIVHPVPEIVAEFRQGLPRVIDPVPLCPIKHGQVLFLLPDRLAEFDSEQVDRAGTHVLRLASQTRLEKFGSLAAARDGGLWISGLAGLLKLNGPLRYLKPGTQCQEYVPPENLQVRNLQSPHEGPTGGVTMVGESASGNQKLLVHFGDQKWMAEAPGTDKIRQAWRGVDGSFWISTIDSLQVWGGGTRQTIENEEVTARQFFDVAVERDGAFWIATSDGLLRFAPLTWRTPAAVRQVVSPVSCLAVDQGGGLWFVASNSLHSLRGDQHQQYPLPASLASEGGALRGVYALKNGSLVLAADNQMQVFRPATGKFAAVVDPRSAGRLNCIGKLRDGTLVVDRPRPDAEWPGYALSTFDGVSFSRLAEPTRDVFVGTNLLGAYRAENGDLWLCGDGGLAVSHDGKWRTFAARDRGFPGGGLWFAELPGGRMWCATRDRVWEFTGDNWVVVRSGFDHINGLLRARDGSVWLACNSGLQHYAQGAWIENGREEGLPATAIQDVCEDPHGPIWAGTSHGLSLYHPEADPDPPKTFIHGLTAKESNVPEGGTITLAFGGEDKWNYTRHQRLLYSHRLDGQDWSDYEPANNIAFVDLPAGKHRFEARAIDRNGNVDPTPARVEFAVILPWYKELRLVLIMLTGLASVVFFAGLAFNRHRQLLRSYAQVEKKVAERTRELEIAHRALAHSQKMNALGTLAAGVAHDFNNILSIIKGSAQIIEENAENPQKVAARVDRIKTVVEQGAGIVKAMLGFSSDAGQEPGPCDVNEVVGETLKLLGDRFLRDVHISFERAPGLPKADASRELIQQVVLNFVLNAAESMDQHKRIVLTTYLLPKLPAELALAPTSGPSYIAISVEDFGCGIPPENMPRIFEPFFTTKAMSARRGTGLGLSMVYELAKRMDAGLAVESVVSQGSVFTLILPVKQTTAQQKLEL